MSVDRYTVRISAMTGLAVFLSGCVVESGPPPGGPILIPDRPGICTMEFDPVCARRGPRERTFTNACMARAEGYRLSYPGECRFTAPPPGPGPGRPGGFCTREYAPVCAVRGGRAETFANDCEARSEGYRVIADGQCRMSRPRG